MHKNVFVVLGTDLVITNIPRNHLNNKNYKSNGKSGILKRFYFGTYNKLSRDFLPIWEKNYDHPQKPKESRKILQMIV